MDENEQTLDIEGNPISGEESGAQENEGDLQTESGSGTDIDIDVPIGGGGLDVSLVDHIVDISLNLEEVDARLDTLNDYVESIYNLYLDDSAKFEEIYVVTMKDHTPFVGSDINEFSVTNVLLLFIFLLLVAQFILKSQTHVDASMKIRKGVRMKDV